MSLHPARVKSASATSGTAIAGRCLGSDGNQHIGAAFRVAVPVASSFEPREDIMDSIAPAAANCGFGDAPYVADRGGTLESNGPNPSAIVRCAMTASRSPV
jgi:hypothetical protein